MPSFWFAVLTFSPMIVSVALIFGVYIAIKVIQFMNKKVRLDEERNRKLDVLIAALNEDKEQ